MFKGEDPLLYRKGISKSVAQVGVWKVGYDTITYCSIWVQVLAVFPIQASYHTESWEAASNALRS